MTDEELRVQVNELTWGRAILHVRPNRYPTKGTEYIASLLERGCTRPYLGVTALAAEKALFAAERRYREEPHRIVMRVIEVGAY